MAYAALWNPQRRIMHRQVAMSLEAFHGTEAADVAGAMATHFREAGMWAKAV